MCVIERRMSEMEVTNAWVMWNLEMFGMKAKNG
jgi:hypothetical protein